MRYVVPFLVFAAMPGALLGQDPHDHTSPYAAKHDSEVPSLTSEEIEQFRAGEGMGFAKAAELNSYPGPKHALEMAGELGLSEDQITALEAIRAAMLADAIRLGEELIEAENTLNRRFQHRHIDGEILRSLIEDVESIRAELRFVHLSAHISTTALLSEAQIAAYNRLRGYGQM